MQTDYFACIALTTGDPDYTVEFMCPRPSEPEVPIRLNLAQFL